ncbi:MAG: phage terminase Nu1 subunit (DNA packaging protein) [Pseudoalteromonas distincta]|jgi:phage terminase Nu1 subunit (DNA packaging protein)
MATQKEIADFFGCDARTIRNWQNIPGFPQSKGAGGYSTQAVARWRISYLEQINKSKQEPEQPPADDEIEKLELAERKAKLRDRLLIIQKREFDLSVLRQKFAPITIITRTLERVSVSMASNLDSLLPHMKRAWPEMPVESVDVIKKVIAQCRNEVAEIEPDLSDFNPSDFESGEDGIDPINY